MDSLCNKNTTNNTSYNSNSKVMENDDDPSSILLNLSKNYNQKNPNENKCGSGCCQIDESNFENQDDIFNGVTIKINKNGIKEYNVEGHIFTEDECKACGCTPVGCIQYYKDLEKPKRKQSCYTNEYKSQSSNKKESQPSKKKKCSDCTNTNNDDTDKDSIIIESNDAITSISSSSEYFTENNNTHHDNNNTSNDNDVLCDNNNSSSNSNDNSNNTTNKATNKKDKNDNVYTLDYSSKNFMLYCDDNICNCSGNCYCTSHEGNYY